MRNVRRALALAIVAFLFGCGPDPDAAKRAADRIATSNSAVERADARRDRLAQIDARIADLEEGMRPEDGAAADAELDRRAREDEEMIASLNVELAIQRSTDGNEMEALRSRQDEESVVLQQRLADLARRIQAQEAVVVERQRRMATAIAPEGGDLRNQVESDYAAAANELASLRSSYRELVESQSTLPDRYYSEQRAAISDLRSRQGELAELIASARADLDSIRLQKNERAAASRARARELAELRAERAAASKAE